MMFNPNGYGSIPVGPSYGIIVPFEVGAALSEELRVSLARMLFHKTLFAKPTTRAIKEYVSHTVS